MSRLIWIYTVCKSLLVSPVAVKELKIVPACFHLQQFSSGQAVICVLLDKKKDLENCSQVTVHQIVIFFQGYSTPNFHRVITY